MSLTTAIAAPSASSIAWDTEVISISSRVVILANLGPLTTTFTPSSYCFSIYYFTSQAQNALGGISGATSYRGPDCWPPSYIAVESVPVTHTQADVYGYYSPGICPSGYVTACADHTSLGDDGYCCCPSGYECDDTSFGYPRWCRSVVVGTATLTNIDKTEETQMITSGEISTSIIRIRAGPTPMVVTGTSRPTATLGTDLGTPIHGAHTVHRGLGIGAVIGITVPVLLIVVALGVFWLWYRRRARRADLGQVETGPQRYELDSKPAPMVGIEADSVAVHELPVRVQNGYSGIGPGVAEVQPEEVHELQHQPYPNNIASGVPVVNGEASRREGNTLSRHSPHITNDLFPATNSPTATTPPEDPNVPEDEEMRWMKLEQEKLRERRERLQMLEQLEVEEAGLRQRMRERRERLEGGGVGGV